MQNGRKAVWRIPYVSGAFFPNCKQYFIAYRSSKVSSLPDCIFEIHQLCQSGFSRVYSNCCYSCSLEPEIIEIGQPSHKMYSNNIVNFQECTTMLNACTNKGWKPIECTTYVGLRNQWKCFTFLRLFFFFCILPLYFWVYSSFMLYVSWSLHHMIIYVFT